MQNGYVETAAEHTVPDQVDLRSMSWFFDEIPKQNAMELMREHGQLGNFIIRHADKFGQFNMIWRSQGRDIKSAEIIMEEGFYFLDFDDRNRFDSLQSLIKFNMESNLISVPLANKELHKHASQQRFKRKTKRLVFCWYCTSFHDKIHFCTI